MNASRVQPHEKAKPIILLLLWDVTSQRDPGVSRYTPCFRGIVPSWEVCNAKYGRGSFRDLNGHNCLPDI